MNKINKIEEVLPDEAKTFIKLFEKKLCNIKVTCEAVGISRQTYYNWLDKFDTFKKEINNIQEGMYDIVESKIYKKVMVDEDNTMIIFFAKTKMKHRGYVERAEFAGVDGESLFNGQVVIHSIGEIPDVTKIESTE